MPGANEVAAQQGISHNLDAKVQKTRQVLITVIALAVLASLTLYFAPATTPVAIKSALKAAIGGTVLLGLFEGYKFYTLGQRVRSRAATADQRTTQNVGKGE